MNHLAILNGAIHKFRPTAVAFVLRANVGRVIDLHGKCLRRVLPVRRLGLRKHHGNVRGSVEKVLVFGGVLRRDAVEVGGPRGVVKEEAARRRDVDVVVAGWSVNDVVRNP
jgi:hypothetical protein